MERGISSTGGQTGREPRKNPRSGDLRQRKKLRNGSKWKAKGTSAHGAGTGRVTV